jgi:hypothetical protein
LALALKGQNGLSLRKHTGPPRTATPFPREARGWPVPRPTPGTSVRRPANPNVGCLGSANGAELPVPSKNHRPNHSPTPPTSRLDLQPDFLLVSSSCCAVTKLQHDRKLQSN